MVRTTSRPGDLAAAVSKVVHESDSSQPIMHMMTLEQFMTNSLAPQRFNMLMLQTFAVIALILATLGIYSVLAYTVRRRVREIGIRMALGAQITDVLRLIVADGMKPALIGLGVGIIGAPANGTRAGQPCLWRVDARPSHVFDGFTVADRRGAAGYRGAGLPGNAR